MKPVPLAERLRVALVSFRNRFRRTTAGRVLRFLPWPIQLALLGAIALAIPIGIVLFVSDQIERRGYDAQRIARVDAAIGAGGTAKASDYCRGLYGGGPLYAACAGDERRGYRQFAAAWARGKGLSTLREQMITCFSAAQEMHGTSWRTAARCAEADTPLPGDPPGG